MRTGTDWASALEPAWRDLFADTPAATPFQSFEWTTIWARHFLGHRRPLAFAFYEGQDLVGVYPAYVSKGAWRALRPMGLGQSDYLAPLARTGREESVARALRETVASLPKVDLIDFQQVRETHPLVSEAPGLIEQANCLVAELPATYDEYAQSLGKNQRYKLSKLRRQVLEAGRAEIEFVAPETAASFAEELFALHRTRWRKRLLPGVFVGRRRQDFHREILASPIAFASRLKTMGRTVGVVYCFRAGTGLYYYQAGFDPELGHLSPGTLLLAESIRRAMEGGARAFDMMRGDEPYKRNWKPTAVYRNVRLILPGAGLRHRAGQVFNRRAAELESRLRARFEGKGLLG